MDVNCWTHSRSLSTTPPAQNTHQNQLLLLVGETEAVSHTWAPHMDIHIRLDMHREITFLSRKTELSTLQTCLPSAFTSAREETGTKQNRNDAGTRVGASFLLKGQQKQAKRDRHKVSQVCMRLTYLCMEKKSPREKCPSQRSKIK